jgi:exopolysaccharide biosynthesis polyprenyl glycosylphosphotransferase
MVAMLARRSVIGSRQSVESGKLNADSCVSHRIRLIVRLDVFLCGFQPPTPDIVSVASCQLSVVGLPMKRSELFFSAIRVPVDYGMIVLAALAAFTIRDLPETRAFFELGRIGRVFSFDEYFMIALSVAPFFLLIYAFEGLYDIRATRRFWQEAHKVFSATTIALVVLIIAIFLKREWFSSRFIILLAWSLSVVFVVLGRYLIHSIQRWLLVARGTGVHRVLLIGRNGALERLKRTFSEKPRLGYRLSASMGTVSIREIKEIRKQEGVDEIIVCDPSIPDEEQTKLLDYCQVNNIAYKYLPTTLQTSRFSVRMFEGEPFIEAEHTPLDGWGKILKRAFDMVGSLVLLILFSPVMILVAILIKIEDPLGPIIYKNKRIGEDGKEFFVYKFRYMKWEYCITKENPNFEKALAFEQELIAERNVRDSVLYKIKDDPRKMRVGAFIERYSIDELPQFFNVLLGSMSLVGPRPHQAREVEKYKEYHRRLLTVKPGITGMAQVSGRSDLAFEDEYKLDVFYIENWSIFLDITLCFKTLRVLLRRRKNV